MFVGRYFTLGAFLANKTDILYGKIMNGNTFLKFNAIMAIFHLNKMAEFRHALKGKQLLQNTLLKLCKHNITYPML